MYKILRAFFSPGTVQQIIPSRHLLTLQHQSNRLKESKFGLDLVQTTQISCVWIDLVQHLEHFHLHDFETLLFIACMN
jgi:hypothetical protein